MSDYTPNTGQIRNAYGAHLGDCNKVTRDALNEFDRWLADVEAAVRAYQIEKDAALAEKVADESPYGFQDHSNEIVAAIRAQLTEGTDHE